LISLQDAEKKAAEERKNELFVGGLDERGGGSGLAVEGPPSSIPGNSVFDRIVQRAQDSGNAGAPLDQISSGSRRVITLYRNGFIVDDGPFRDMNSPQNQAFIRALEQGFVPPG
jgi:UBX domain-containing protein 1